MSDIGLPKILDLFEQGKKLTQDLMRENERLRLKVQGLKNENAELAGRVQDETGSDLQERLQTLNSEAERLKKENDRLRNQFDSIEGENREFAERFLQVEQQNSDLISLYVATYRLHSTLDYLEVVNIVKEIVINMIGADTFGLFVLNEDGRTVSLIAHEGMEGWLDAGQGLTVPLGQGVVGRTAQDGELHVVEGVKAVKPGEDPIACFPLIVSKQLVGVIAIYCLLEQKETFHSVDYELFTLLGGHAATALYGAKMYTLSERRRNTLEGFVNLVKQSGKLPKR